MIIARSRSLTMEYHTVVHVYARAQRLHTLRPARRHSYQNKVSEQPGHALTSNCVPTHTHSYCMHDTHRIQQSHQQIHGRSYLSPANVRNDLTVCSPARPITRPPDHTFPRAGVPTLTIALKRASPHMSSPTCSVSRPLPHPPWPLTHGASA